MTDETRPDNPCGNNLLAKLAINDCELSVRTTNALQRSGRYKTLADLDAASDDELRRVPHFGVKGIAEIRSVIRSVRFGALSPNEEVTLWAIDHATLVTALMRGEAVIVPTAGRAAA